MNQIKINNARELRSGMLFTTDPEYFTASYMIVSNDMAPNDENWEGESEWIVVWFQNTQNDPTFPGLTWHGKGADEKPRTLKQMYHWIDEDACIGCIDRAVLKTIYATAEEVLK